MDINKIYIDKSNVNRVKNTTYKTGRRRAGEVYPDDYPSWAAPNRDDTTEDLFYYRHQLAVDALCVTRTTARRALYRDASASERHGRARRASYDDDFVLLPKWSMTGEILQRIDTASRCTAPRHRLILRLRAPMMPIHCSLHQLYLMKRIMDTIEDEHTRRTRTLRASLCPCDKDLTRPASSSARSHTSSVLFCADKMTCRQQGQDDGDGLCVKGAPRGLCLYSNVMPNESAALPMDDTHRRRAASRTRCTISSPECCMTSAQVDSRADITTTGYTNTPDEHLVRGTPQRVPPPRAHLSDKALDEKAAFRLEALLNHVAIHIFDDDPTSHRPQAQPRFIIRALHIELIALMYDGHQAHVVTIIDEMNVVAAEEAMRPLMGGASGRIDARLRVHEPHDIGIRLGSGATLRLGSPFMDFMDCVMDLLNICLPTPPPPTPHACVAHAASGAANRERFRTHATRVLSHMTRCDAAAQQVPPGGIARTGPRRRRRVRARIMCATRVKRRRTGEPGCRTGRTATGIR